MAHRHHHKTDLQEIGASGANPPITPQGTIPGPRALVESAAWISRVSDRRYLAIFLVLGLAAGLLVVATFLFGSPNTGPRALKEIAPLPGSQVPLQTPIEVDLPVGYRVEILVDGFRVPDSEVRFVEGTSVHSWAPARSSTIVWRLGPHTVSVRWRKVSRIADEGEYSWDFRVF